MTIELTLDEKPEDTTLIEAFPGIGLIGTIVTEFLVKHTDTRKIGKVTVEDLPAIAAIHEGKLNEPISIHYSEEYDITILHALTSGEKLGWKMSKVIQEVSEEIKPEEIISIEGVGTSSKNSDKENDDVQIFYYSSEENNDLENIAEPLQEGIVVGPTGALLSTQEKFNTQITTLFAETHSKLPDSSAAASVVKALDKYIDMDVDPEPLREQAKQFENQLQQLMQQNKQLSESKKKDKLSYLG